MVSVPAAVGALLPILFALGVSAPIPATLFGSVLLFSGRGGGVRPATSLCRQGLGRSAPCGPLTFSPPRMGHEGKSAA